MNIPERLSLPDEAGGWMEVEIVRPQDGQWVSVIGGGGSHTPPPFVPDVGPVRNIATNTGVLQNGWTPGATGAATATRHMLHANATSITIGYLSRPNPKFGAATSTPLRAWVRPQGGTWEPLTFGGQAEVTLTVPVSTDEALLPSHAQNFYSDPVPGTWRYGDVIEVLTWGQSTGGTVGVQGDLDGAYDIGRVDGTPTAVPTAPIAAFVATGKGTRPSVVLAPSQKSSWALIGDSNSVNPARSYMSQAFRARNLAHIINGKHGLGTYHLNDGWWDFQLGEQAEYSDSIFSALGTNDGNKVGANLPQEMVSAWERAKAAGIVRWVQATIAPRSLTAGSQTPLNPWLRDGAPIVAGLAVAAGSTDPAAVRATVITHDGIIRPGTGTHPMGTGWVTDTAGVMESSVGSGAYRQDLDPQIYNPGDLTHYTQAGHDIQAPVLERALALMGF